MSLANQARQRQEFAVVVKEIFGASDAIDLASDEFTRSSSDETIFRNASYSGDSVTFRKRPMYIITQVMVQLFSVGSRCIES